VEVGQCQIADDHLQEERGGQEVAAALLRRAAPA
jgi:hypothetical protein